MPTQITMPQLGESIHEGTIGKWLKQPGEQVEKYEAVVEIITDKVNAEIPSPVDGVLTTILVQEGTTVEIGAVLAEMQETGAELATPFSANTNGTFQSAGTSGADLKGEAQPKPFSPISTSQNGQNNQNGGEPLPEEEPTGSFPAGRAVAGWYEEKSIMDGADEPESAQEAGTPPSGGKSLPRLSPAVRRLAEEHDLDLAALKLKGSGLGGRLTRDDLLNYLQQSKPEKNPAPEPLERGLPQAITAHPGAFQPVITGAMQVPLESGSSSETKTVPGETSAASNTAAAFTVPPASPVSPSPAPARPVSAPLIGEGPAFTPEMFAGGSDEIVPLTPMRKAIAEHMARSKQTTPHAWTIVEVDLTRLVLYRASIKDQFKRQEGLDLSYLPFVLKAVVEGLRQFPRLNAIWSPERGGIIVKRELNLGVAVDVPDGLVVPVIHNAGEKNLPGLARSLQDLISRSREKKLTLPDVQGGTFTVNNPGAFGSVLSYPIINQPQAAIVTMEAIVKRPVVITDGNGSDSISVRSIMNMCLSFDHRVVDGAYAGRFLQFVKMRLEEPPKVE